MPMRNAGRVRCMPTPTHARIDLEEGESDMQPPHAPWRFAAVGAVRAPRCLVSHRS